MDIQTTSSVISHYLLKMKSIQNKKKQKEQQKTEYIYNSGIPTIMHTAEQVFFLKSTNLFAKYHQIIWSNKHFSAGGASL